MALSDDCCDFTNIEGHLGHQYGSGPASQARMQSNPSSVATHYFDHHYTVVTFCGGVQTVDCIGGYLHRSLKPERCVGTNHVVVNCFGHADNWQTMVVGQH